MSLSDRFAKLKSKPTAATGKTNRQISQKDATRDKRSAQNQARRGQPANTAVATSAAKGRKGKKAGLRKSSIALSDKKPLLSHFYWYHKGAKGVKGAKAPNAKSTAPKKDVKEPANQPDLDKDMDSCKLPSLTFSQTWVVSTCFTITSLSNETDHEDANCFYIDILNHSRTAPAIFQTDSHHITAYHMKSYLNTSHHITSHHVIQQNSTSIRAEYERIEDIAFLSHAQLSSHHNHICLYLDLIWLDPSGDNVLSWTDEIWGPTALFPLFICWIGGERRIEYSRIIIDIKYHCARRRQ